VRYIYEPRMPPVVTELADGTKVAEFPLGYELDLNTIVYEQVVLVRADSYLSDRHPEAYDLQFGIREKLAEDPLVQTCLDYSVISSRRFVPREGRHWVLNNGVLHCVEELVNRFAPAQITMQTYHPNVPPSGMAKYQRITELLSAHEYAVEENFQGTDGIHYWFYVRKALKEWPKWAGVGLEPDVPETDT
jgi:hypothetical protein